MNSNLLQIRRDRDFHHRKARKTNSKYSWGMYRKLRNYANREERKLKSAYFCQLIEDSKFDGSRMWKTLKQVLPSSNSKNINGIRSNDTLYTKTADLVEILNKHFVTIAQKLAYAFGKFQRLPTFESKTDAQFGLHCVSEEYVKFELSKLKTNKAIGLDKISAKLLKDASEVIGPSIQKLINMSITQSCFPNLWKSAKVTAIFKSGDPKDCDNCRPISILPTVSKILERAVKSQLYSYLEENGLLYTQHSGFR